MIKIFTYAFNNPRYLEYQIKSFKKFMTEPFEFYCIDNSIDMNVRQQLHRISINHNIKYFINKKPDHSLHGLSHYSALQWSYNNLMQNENDLCLIIDHDMFPIKSFSLLEIMDNHSIAGASHTSAHIEYMHPSLIILDLNKLPNKEKISFYGGNIDGINVDIGGELYLYFKENPNISIKYLKSFSVDKNSEIISNDLKSYYDCDAPFDIIESIFLHTRLGSNWLNMHPNEFDHRDKLIYSILEQNLK